MKKYKIQFDLMILFCHLNQENDNEHVKMKKNYLSILTYTLVREVLSKTYICLNNLCIKFAKQTAACKQKK